MASAQTNVIIVRLDSEDKSFTPPWGWAARRKADGNEHTLEVVQQHRPRIVVPRRDIAVEACSQGSFGFSGVPSFSLSRG